MDKFVDITQAYEARWTDEGYPQRTFIARIARLDKPENLAYWDSLSEDEQRNLDDTIFYFVYQDGEIEQLHKEDTADFQLLGEAE